MATSQLQSLLFVLSLFLSLTRGAVTFRWTSEIENDAAIFVCQGQDLVLPWNVSSTIQSPYTIQWYYQGLSEEIIAMMTHGHFAPSPTFSGRVQFLPLAGIIVKNVVPSDKGNYSVEVFSNDGTGRQNVVVQISDASSTNSGHLDIEQDRTAVHNERTGEWSVQLTCGHFTSLGHPPIDVVWTTPTGETQPSTNHVGGDFNLLLPNPIRGGNYSCAIAPQPHATSCLPGSSPLLRKAVVNVDEVVARLTLMEARQADLLAGYQHLTETNANLTAGYQHLTQTNANLTAYIHHLEANDANLTSQIHRLQDEVNELTACSEMNYTVLSEDWRATSHAWNYSDPHGDNSLPAGWYRFKLNGANAVMPTSCVQENHCGTGVPLWLNLQRQSLPGVGQQVTGQTCGFGGRGGGECCYSLWSRPATVRNCGTFYIYNLQPAPYGHLAYCTTSN